MTAIEQAITLFFAIWYIGGFVLGRYTKVENEILDDEDL